MLFKYTVTHDLGYAEGSIEAKNKEVVESQLRESYEVPYEDEKGKTLICKITDMQVTLAQ